MLPEILTASFLGVCLGIFYFVNLLNFIRSRGKKKTLPDAGATSEPLEPPKTVLTALAMFGTLVFWFSSFFYVLFVFASVLSFLDNILLPLRFPFDSYVQILGVALSAFGYFLFIWSVVARGPYSTAWKMPTNHKMVTWGPYRYMRHPSYLAYFMLFFGLFFIWLTWIALIPLAAIPGYVQIVKAEEEMLIQRFGDEYQAYRKEVGRFFPQRRAKKH